MKRFMLLKDGSDLVIYEEEITEISEFGWAHVDLGKVNDYYAFHTDFWYAFESLQEAFDVRSGFISNRIDDLQQQIHELEELRDASNGF